MMLRFVFPILIWSSGPALAQADRPHIIYLPIDNWGFTVDGRGYAWHQIIQLGEFFFGGEPVPAGCPKPPVKV